MRIVASNIHHNNINSDFYRIRMIETNEGLYKIVAYSIFNEREQITLYSNSDEFNVKEHLDFINNSFEAGSNIIYL